MITALVLASRSPEALGATLAALVSGVPDGLVGNAVVLTRDGERELLRVADAMGAAHVIVPAGAEPWGAGLSAARRDWLLCLEAGDVLLEGWVGALDRFVAAGISERCFGRLQREPRRLGQTLLDLARPRSTRGVRAGDLVHRSLLGARGSGRGRPLPVPARIWRDPAFD